MTIQQIIRKYQDIEIDFLLAHVLKQSKEFLYLNPETKVTKEQNNKITKLITRRQKGEPIAYLVGYKYFYGLKFKVNKQVLTPRPETEWLVDKALSTVKSGQWTVDSKRKAKTSILDLGTGSGCIAVSIAYSLRTLPGSEGPSGSRTTRHSALNTTITASDISKSALKIAQQNAMSYKVGVQFVQSDLFSKISGTFDIIVANLPYVPQGMYELLYHNLKYEPKVAITDGGEVWDMYRRFFTQLPKHLKPGGTALLEIDDGSKPDLQKMVKILLPKYKTTFYKDMKKLWRYLEITS